MMNIIDKIIVLLFGQHMKEGYYTPNKKVRKDNYLPEAIFPDEETMEQAFEINISSMLDNQSTIF